MVVSRSYTSLGPQLEEEGRRSGSQVFRGTSPIPEDPSPTRQRTTRRVSIHRCRSSESNLGPEPGTWEGLCSNLQIKDCRASSSSAVSFFVQTGGVLYMGQVLPGKILSQGYWHLASKTALQSRKPLR